MYNIPTRAAEIAAATKRSEELLERQEIRLCIGKREVSVISHGICTRTRIVSIIFTFYFFLGIFLFINSAGAVNFSTNVKS